MGNLANQQRRIAEGTSGWLLFEFNCQRGDLFSEKYLAASIGQILTGIYPGRIKAEFDHPQLSKDGVPGRPPQIDFVIKNRDEIEKAVESKWVGKSMVSIGQIVWDLLRLELVATNLKCKALVVIAGFAKKLADILDHTDFIEGAKGSKKITTKHKQSIYLDLKDLDNTSKSFLNERIERYDISVPGRLKFTFPHQYPGKTHNMSFQTIVWEVRPGGSAHRIKQIV